MPGLIPTWSFSRLEVFEKCPRRAELAFKEKIPEPKQPNSPAERGNVVHDGLDKFVFQGGKQLPPEANQFKTEVLKLKDLAKAKRAEGEQMWSFDRDWMPVDEKDYERTWVRIKLDFLAWLSDVTALAGDYKTGKRYGNEIKHGAQLQLYSIASLLKFPRLESVVTELWYLDQDIISKVRYRRDQALRHLQSWTERGARLTEAKSFPAKPSTFNCSWCPYKIGKLGKTSIEGTGHCALAP